MANRYEFLSELMDDIWHQCGYAKKMDFWEMVNMFANDPEDEHHKEAIEFRDKHHKFMEEIRAAARRGDFDRIHEGIFPA